MTIDEVGDAAEALSELANDFITKTVKDIWLKQPMPGLHDEAKMGVLGFYMIAHGCALYAGAVGDDRGAEMLRDLADKLQANPGARH